MNNNYFPIVSKPAYFKRFLKKVQSKTRYKALSNE